MQELKDFSIYVAKKLKIENKIDTINLFYTKNFHGYYPKGKPMYGFYKLFHNRQVRIDLTKHWDVSQKARKKSIVHELTHVKQMSEKRLVVSKDFKNIIWNDKINISWKKWRFAVADKLKAQKCRDYTKKFLPWEREVETNTYKFFKQ